LALAQPSRAVEQRQNKWPQLSDLRDSGSLERDSDVVLFIYRDAYYAQMEGREVEEGKEHIAEITVANYRNGPTGDVQLYFQADQTMFYLLEHALGQDKVIKAYKFVPQCFKKNIYAWCAIVLVSSIEVRNFFFDPRRALRTEKFSFLSIDKQISRSLQWIKILYDSGSL